MFLSPKEMELLCVFHSGTISATLELLNKADDKSPERMALVISVIKKLSSLEEGQHVSLAFDAEK